MHRHPQNQWMVSKSESHIISWLSATGTSALHHYHFHNSFSAIIPRPTMRCTQFNVCIIETEWMKGERFISGFKTLWLSKFLTQHSYRRTAESNGKFWHLVIGPNFGVLHILLDAEIPKNAAAATCSHWARWYPFAYILGIVARSLHPRWIYYYEY